VTADLLVIVPTRGRRVLLERFLAAADATREAATDLLVVTDDDDTGTYAGMALPRGARMVTQPRMWLGPKLNAHAVPAALEYPVVGFLADDVICESPGWDSLLLGALETPGIAYGQDGRRTDVPEHPIVSSVIVTALGWFCEPSLRHYYADDVLAGLGNAASCLRFAPRAVMAHLHYSRHPPAGRDATYTEAEANGPPTGCGGATGWRATRPPYST
jgi:hypothetical protein